MSNQDAVRPAASFRLLDDYLTYMEAILGRSPATIKEYRYDLLLFFRFIRKERGEVAADCEPEQVDLSDIGPDYLNGIRLSDFYNFLNYLLRSRRASAANRARKVSSLKGFFKYLKSKVHAIAEDPTRELEAPRQAKRLPTYLNLEEARQLLQAADTSEGEFATRDYCILTLFLNCGLRLSELCQIDLKDIREDSLTVLGKGNKERTAYLNGACIAALNDYLEVRPHKGLKDPEALFISRQGNRIAPATVQRAIKKYLLRAGLDSKRYSTHKLRHTAATLMHKYGKVDIRHLQAILGHESVATTEIYTHIDVADLHQAVENNPLAAERPDHPNKDG